MLALNATSVAQHYNKSGFEYEFVRLHEHSPIDSDSQEIYLSEARLDYPDELLNWQ